MNGNETHDKEKSRRRGGGGRESVGEKQKGSGKRRDYKEKVNKKFLSIVDWVALYGFMASSAKLTQFWKTIAVGTIYFWVKLQVKRQRGRKKVFKNDSLTFPTLTLFHRFTFS